MCMYTYSYLICQYDPIISYNPLLYSLSHMQTSSPKLPHRYIYTHTHIYIHTHHTHFLLFPMLPILLNQINSR